MLVELHFTLILSIDGCYNDQPPSVEGPFLHLVSATILISFKKKMWVMEEGRPVSPWKCMGMIR